MIKINMPPKIKRGLNPRLGFEIKNKNNISKVKISKRALQARLLRKTKD
jgi:hypothetical protein